MHIQFKKFSYCFLIIISLTFPLLSKAADVLETKDGIIVIPFTGYRYDILQWSIPDGKTSNLRKLSELTWKNYIFETGVKIETKPEKNEFNFQGQLKYGYILKKSTCQDSDWDSIGEFSRSFNTVKGNVLDVSGAIGFSRNLANTIITYYVGIDYTKYRMFDFGLYYVINRYQDTNINLLDSMPRYPSSQLITTYKFNNYNPWIGASINYSWNDKFAIIPTVKMCLFYLSGEGDWLLRPDLAHPSFKDKSFGIGASFDTELLYKYSNNLDFRVNVGIKKLAMIKGTKLRFTNNSTYGQDLKKLSFLSSSVSAGIKYHF